MEDMERRTVSFPSAVPQDVWLESEMVDAFPAEELLGSSPARGAS